VVGVCKTAEVDVYSLEVVAVGVDKYWGEGQWELVVVALLEVDG